MLEAIGRKENIPQALARAKDKSDPFRLMGFGHRVYKTFDPRFASYACLLCMHARGLLCLRCHAPAEAPRSVLFIGSITLRFMWGLWEGCAPRVLLFCTGHG